MPRVFNVTAPAGTVHLDKNGQGEVTYTVTNDSGRPQRSLARVVALEGAKQEWFTVAGELERDLPVQGAQQYLVRIAVPKGTASGLSKVRMDAVSAVRDANEFTEGPTVVFEIPKQDKPPNPLPWIIAGAAVLVIVVGVFLYIALQPKVPNVVGKSVGDARTILAAKELKLGVTGFTYQSGLADSAVVTQVPAANSKPASNDSVQVTLNTLTVTIPPLAGSDVVPATETLLALSLIPKILSQPSNQTLLTVVSTTPTAGTLAHRGDSVTLTLATTPGVIWHPINWKSALMAKGVSPEKIAKVIQHAH